MNEKIEKIKNNIKNECLKDDKEKGITLVALVVTIVVLLILAGVSINLVLGDNGIINKAKEARDKSADGSQNDLAAMDELDQQLDYALAREDFTKKNTKVLISGEEVWIPEGFKISDDSASTVQGGVVIEDKDQNQFVWIPVASISDYKRTAYSTNVDTNTIDSSTNSTKINLSSSRSYYSTEALPSDEQTSVSTYKGYYIGRYEAGDKESTEEKTLRAEGASTSNEITIKANQAPYNYVTRTQAKSLAENFGTQQNYNTTIKTKLVSSYAWDTAIAFIQKSVNNYGNSSAQGNYYDTTFTYNDITAKDGEEKTQTKDQNSSALVATGQTTPVCNIYDMGGNVVEWTTESFSDTGYPYTCRGGYYNVNYASHPAGNRNVGSGNASSSIGFRLTLFL